MDYVWIRLDQKGPDNNLCAKRVCLGKSVTLHLVAAVTLHLVAAVFESRPHFFPSLLLYHGSTRCCCCCRCCRRCSSCWYHGPADHLLRGGDRRRCHLVGAFWPLRRCQCVACATTTGDAPRPHPRRRITVCARPRESGEPHLRPAVSPTDGTLRTGRQHRPPPCGVPRQTSSCRGNVGQFRSRHIETGVRGVSCPSTRRADRAGPRSIY